MGESDLRGMSSSSSSSSGWASSSDMSIPMEYSEHIGVWVSDGIIILHVDEQFVMQKMCHVNIIIILISECNIMVHVNRRDIHTSHA